MLLKEVEKKDVELSKQLDKRIAEKTDIIMKMAEITEKITKAKLDVADVVEAERRVASEFETLVPSNHPNRPQFLNIFKKKGHSKKVRLQAYVGRLRSRPSGSRAHGGRW